MSQDESAGMERRRKEKEQELYGGMTFAPDIDPLSRAMGRTRGLQELVDNTIGQKVRAVSKMIADRIEESKCTFKPCINSYPIYNQNSSFASDERNDVSRYNADLTPTCWTAGAERRIHGSEITSGSVEVDDDSLDPISQYWQPAGSAEGLRSRQFDGKHQDQYRSCTINLEEPERMARNIKQQLAEKEERRRAELIAREIEEMKECTFRPTISTYPPGGNNSSYSQSSHSSAPVVVRGLSRHLELRHLSIKQREDAERREKEVFSVKNIDQFRRVQDGSTIVKVQHALLLSNVLFFRDYFLIRDEFYTSDHDAYQCKLSLSLQPFLFSDMSNRSCSQTTIGHEFNPNLTNTSTAGTVSYNNRSRLGIMQR